jgi:hypothetical protein
MVVKGKAVKTTATADRAVKAIMVDHRKTNARFEETE